MKLTDLGHLFLAAALCCAAAIPIIAAPVRAQNAAATTDDAADLAIKDRLRCIAARGNELGYAHLKAEVPKAKEGSRR